MTQEEKSLLLKDLSARLPYGVMIQHPNLFYPSRMVVEKLVSIDREHINDDGMTIEYVKPYLRPISSMTEEEKKEFHHIASLQHNYIGDDIFYTHWCMFDWLNANYFDYRGLIPMGLAIEVTEENNPYKE